MRRLDRKKYLTRGEVARLLTLAHGFTDPSGNRDYVFVSLLLNSGLRISELTRLRVGDLGIEQVEDEEGSFTLHSIDVWDGKGEVSRRVFVNEPIHRLVDRFTRGKSNDSPVFSHIRQGVEVGYTRRAFTYRLKRLLALAGLPAWYSNHSLRHTYAVTYYETTKSLQQLKEQLGHASLSTTQIYLTTTKREHHRNLQAVRPLLASARQGASHAEG